MILSAAIPTERRCKLTHNRVNLLIVFHFNVKEVVATFARSIVKNSYYHNYGERPLDISTVGQALERAANNWPDRPIFISDTSTLTFSQLLEQADKFASGLLALGLQPGDRIGIWSPNSIRWFIIMMAASRIGLITVAINPANQVKELEYCLQKVDLKALAIPSSYKLQDFYGLIRNLMPELSQTGKLKSSKIPSLETVIIMDDKDLEGTYQYKDILNLNNNYNISSMQSSISPDVTFSILFTSGTTGLPKAAMQSHLSYLNNSKTVGYRCEFDREYQRVCLQVPFFHAMGLLIAMAALQHGATLVIPAPTFNSDKSMESISQYKCSVLTGTPTMYVDMIKKQNELEIDLSTPQIAITGGAPCSPELFNQMRKHLGVNIIKSIYGMTEVCSVLHSVTNEDFYKAADTIGKVMDHVEIKVVDSDGMIVPIGSPGELYVRGYSNMIGYWEDKQKTSEIINKENWLKTGDQIILGEDGYAKISGRIKDIIIRGGENIFPKEVEDFLNTHPDILETQVFGIKDDRLGEEICASVRIKNGSTFDYNHLKKFCIGSIAHFKIPRYLKIVDEFPKTASGKIQKYVLKEMVENGKL